MNHPILMIAAVLVAILCVAVSVLHFFTEGKTDRYVGKTARKFMDAALFGLLAPVFIVFAILVNIASALPWRGPSNLLAKLK